MLTVLILFFTVDGYSVILPFSYYISEYNIFFAMLFSFSLRIWRVSSWINYFYYSHKFSTIGYHQGPWNIHRIHKYLTVHKKFWLCQIGIKWLWCLRNEQIYLIQNCFFFIFRRVLLLCIMLIVVKISFCTWTPFWLLSRKKRGF